ncbi:uncharacterized protein LOC119683386 [Teleopsis dalmanni]|uniref:uncharacterized protein LOC119683386 n=1 Tax=Teleopsis dalmanni TaxID=139649 RepID=UPI0018CE1EDD|nr:uncharacterized protein LOC119683386 [Teleopsis dalmanni]XP_037952976.1 uncharacterized protein LOC119683386 [Teleopsis dalmanni]XP_037952977.1 uncharacterized protein LOC119683386 [Teleopsis dalmanni]
MSKAKKTIIIDNDEDSFAFLNSFNPYDKHNARNGKHRVYAKLTNHRQKQSTMVDAKTGQGNVSETHVSDKPVPLTRPVEVPTSESTIYHAGLPKNRKTAQTTARQAMFKDKSCDDASSTFVNPYISMKTHVPYVKDILAMKKLNEATANLNSALMQARKQLESSNLQDSIDVVKTLLATVNENEEVFNNNMSNIQNIAKNSLNVSKTKFESKKVPRNNDIKSSRVVNQSADVLSKNLINIHDMAKNNPYEPKTEFKDLEVHLTNYIESPEQVNKSDREIRKNLVNIEDIAKNSIYAPKKRFKNKDTVKRNNIESPREVNEIDEVIRKNMVKFENIEKCSFLGPKIESMKKKVYREFCKEPPRVVEKNDEVVAKNISNIQNITGEKLHAPKIESKNKGILKKHNIESLREVNEIDEVVRKNTVHFQNIEESSFLGPKIESTEKKVYREFCKEPPRVVDKNDEVVAKDVSNIQNIAREKLHALKTEGILKSDNVESLREVNEIEDVIKKNAVNFPNIEKSSFLAAKTKFAKKKVQRDYNIELESDETDENIGNEKLYVSEIEDEEVYKNDYIEFSGTVNERDKHIDEKKLFATEIDSEKMNILEKIYIDPTGSLNKSDAMLSDDKTEFRNKEVNEEDNIESPRAIEYLNTLFAAMEKADKAKRKLKGMKSKYRFSSADKRLNLEKSAFKLKLKLRQVLNKNPFESLPSSSDSEYDTTNSGLKVNKAKKSLFCCTHHAGVKSYLEKNRIMNNDKLFHIINKDKMETSYKNVGTNCTYLDFKELYKPMVNAAKSVNAGKKLDDLFTQIEEAKLKNQIKDRKHTIPKDISLNWINKQLHFNYMCENCLEGGDNSFYYD